MTHLRCLLRLSSASGRSCSYTVPRPLVVVAGLAAMALAGCSGLQERVASVPLSTTVSGHVHGGQQPVSDATIQLYAAGTSGDGSAATPLLAEPVHTDGNGAFNLAGHYACPTPSSLVYLVATAGNPGLAAGGNNPAAIMMATLGTCAEVTASASIAVNELTTIASVSALAPFLRSPSSVGAAPDNMQAMTEAFATARILVNMETGSAPGLVVPQDQSVPVEKMQTLGNVLSGCINSSGGAAGDGSACGTLFANATSSLNSAPMDTVSAVLQIAQNPTRNVAPLFNLSSPLAHFQPALTSAPSDWKIGLLSTVAAPVFSPAPGTFSSPQSVTLMDSDSSARIYYTLDGGTPSASSTQYTGPITLPISKTIRAVAIANGMSSLLLSGTYTISAPKLVFLSQPPSSVAGTILSPAPAIALEDATGAILSGSNAPVTLDLGANVRPGALSGTATVNAIHGVASFPGLAINAVGIGFMLRASTAGLSPVSSASFNTSGTVSISIPSETAAIGLPTTGSFSLSAGAPQGGVTVSLSSSNPSVISITPSLVTLAPGQTGGEFTYTALASGSADLAANANAYAPSSAHVSAAPPAIPSSFFGMTIQNFQNVAPPLKFGITRSWDAYAGYWDASPGIAWPQISPSPGVYNFAGLESFIKINQSRHADIIYTFGRTPRWASASPNASGVYGPGQCAPPARIADWDAFVRAVATQANGRIRYWELWNEPSYSQSYCGDIPTMVTLAQHARQIIKSVDPTAVILSPAVASNDGPSWLDTFLSLGGGAYVDVFAFHGYWSSTAEDLNSVIATYRNVLTKHNLGTKPMWDTEASWAGRTGGVGGLTDQGQRAAFLAKYFLLHWSQGVTRFLWYAYDSQDIFGRLWDAKAGLHTDGIAYRETYTWMVGASLTSPCSADRNNTWTCALTRPGGYKAEVVWNSSASASFPIPSIYKEYRDLQGGIHSLSQSTISVGNTPILLETGAIPQ